MEKNEMMVLTLRDESLEMMEKLIQVFNPNRRLNPGKLLPTGERLRGDPRRGPGLAGAVTGAVLIDQARS